MNDYLINWISSVVILLTGIALNTHWLKVRFRKNLTIIERIAISFFVWAGLSIFCLSSAFIFIPFGLCAMSLISIDLFIQHVKVSHKDLSSGKTRQGNTSYGDGQ
jgi:hypothetical protein